VRGGNAAVGRLTVIRVLVADDSAAFRFGMSTMLRALSDIDVVGEAATGDEAVVQAARLQPDVVVMDLQMAAASDGATATARIGEQSPHVAVLVMTMTADETAVRAVLRAGARGYLVKGAPREEVERALRTVAAGGLVIGASMAGRAGALLGGERPADPLAALSTREREVLELMADGLDNTAIARRLTLSPKTVRNVVSSVFAKLQTSDRVQVVLQARRLGLGSGSRDVPGESR
jgi:DNA-binding NarL/FixJ family response regulator